MYYGAFSRKYLATVSRKYLFEYFSYGWLFLISYAYV